MLNNGVDNLSGPRDSIIGGQPHMIFSEVTPRSISTRTYVRQTESINPPPQRVVYKFLGSHNPRGLARRGMRGALSAPIRQRILPCLICYSGLLSDAVRVLEYM